MFVTIVVLAGLICTGIGIYRLIHWRRTRSAYRLWPSVEGHVTASSLRASRRYDDDNEEYSVWQPIVAYRYAVEGRDHEGASAFWFDHVFTDQAEADRWLAAVPAGASAEVFYDPARPGRSALVLNQPGSAPGSGLIWLGGALILGGIFGPAFAR